MFYFLILDIILSGCRIGIIQNLSLLESLWQHSFYTSAATRSASLTKSRFVLWRRRLAALPVNYRSSNLKCRQRCCERNNLRTGTSIGARIQRETFIWIKTIERARTESRVWLRKLPRARPCYIWNTRIRTSTEEKIW